MATRTDTCETIGFSEYEAIACHIGSQRLGQYSLCLLGYGTDTDVVKLANEAAAYILDLADRIRSYQASQNNPKEQAA